MSTMKKSTFTDSLQRLESLAKGSGQTQLFATPNDSDPGTWAGTSSEDVDDHTSNIDENGTDYNAVKKALAAKVAASKALTKAEVAIVKGQDPRALIAEKITKGEKLTQAEAWAIKGGVSTFAKASTKPSEAPASGTEAGANKAPETNVGANTDDEIEDDAKKSLAKSITEQPDLQQGIEVSPFLAEFAKAMDAGLTGVEARTSQRVVKAFNDTVGAVTTRLQGLEKALTDQAEFNKGLAEAIVSLGEHLAGQTQVNAEALSLPAGPPKSQVNVVQKSFAGGMDTGLDSLTKSQLVNTMADLVVKGRLNQLDVVKFESTGEISPHTVQLVKSHLSGK